MLAFRNFEFSSPILNENENSQVPKAFDLKYARIPKVPKIFREIANVKNVLCNFLKRFDRKNVAVLQKK